MFMETTAMYCGNYKSVGEMPCYLTLKKAVNIITTAL
jgi:hypothetical protein